MQTSLGFYSEQSMESVHADLKPIWEMNKVAKNHPQFAERLLCAICEYNGFHSC